MEYSLIICVCSLIALTSCLYQTDSDYWFNLGRKSLYDSRKLLGKNKVKKAKNVILFLGDGMGMPTISAARLLKRQLNHDHKLNLVFEEFDHSALIRTYNLDYPVPDSAATGTAFCAGVKANKGTLGVNGHVDYDSKNCTLISKNRVRTVFQKASLKGKMVGIVTTSSVTDATPAATYSHISSRLYEYWAPWEETSQCKDIARQLIENNDFNVILGGGRRNFIPKDTGYRLDGLNLFNMWYHKKNVSKLKPNEFKIINKRKELFDIDNNTKYLFGIFSSGNMKFDKERIESDMDDEPSLEEMTEAAIKILGKGEEGFFLMVEGANIDKAHHANLAYYSLYDVLAFEKAIAKALAITKPEDTLIIVTADHSHSFTHNGGAQTQDDVFGFSEYEAQDGLPFTTLIYSTGPGYKEKREWNEIEIKRPNYQQISAVPLYSATHGGDDVAAYATGPGSDLLDGSQEQIIIAHLMEFSSCIGDYANEEHCNSGSYSIHIIMKNWHVIPLMLIFLLLKHFFFINYLLIS